MAEPVQILMIDDEEPFSFFVKLNLETDSRFKVTTAPRGDEGLKLAKSIKPDLILLDIMMPGMFGTEVAGKLLEDPRTKYIPIIFLTAALKKEEADEMDGRIGGREFIAKPITKEELISRIEATLELKK
ncbi:MAG: response regulator [Deltaproteobacteria bacterium]|nr:response regulator [Deltaproteobacteria bacterium]